MFSLPLNYESFYCYSTTLTSSPFGVMPLIPFEKKLQKNDDFCLWCNPRDFHIPTDILHFFSDFKANMFKIPMYNYRKNRSVLAKLHYQNKLLGPDTRHYWSCMLVLQFRSFSKVCEKNLKRHSACICLTFAVIYNSKQDTVNNSSSCYLQWNFDEKSCFSGLLF